MALRIIFMGTPAFSMPTLEALIAAGHDVVAVYTQPPRPAGRRGLDLKPSPVAVCAEQHGIACHWPTSLKGADEQARFAGYEADVAVVVAYGMLLPQAILDAPRNGCFNAHASLLPRWRGAAPVQRAIMAGDTETGVCIMQMDAGLDTGPVALERRVPITETTTSGGLHDTLSKVGAEAMVEAMAQLETGSVTLTPQPEDGVTYASKIDKAEARIDWSQNADTVHRHIMGLSPFPGAWCQIDDTRVKVLESAVAEKQGTRENAAAGTVLDGLTIACGTGAVRLVTVQKAGGKAMDADAFLRGTPLAAGTQVA